MLLSPARADHAPPWRYVVALAVDQLVAWGVLYYAFGVLLPLIAADLRVSRELVAGIFSAALLTGAVASRPVGRAVDRLGARRILQLGAGCGLAALALLLASTGPLTLLVAFVVAGVAQATALYDVAFAALVTWFPAARARGRALLLVTSVAGFASTVFLPLTAALVAWWGWRAAVALLGFVLAVVAVPVRFSLPGAISRPPHFGPDARPNRDAGPGARLLTLGFALHAFTSTGVAVYLTWLLAERGMPLATAAALAGLAGAAQVPGRLLFAPLEIVVPPRSRLPLLFLLQAAGLAALAAGPSALAIPAVILLGAANGMTTLARTALTVAWFGRRSFGARSGDIASAALLARAAAPYALALVHGGRGYADAFALLALLLVAGALLLVLAERRRHAGSDGTA